MLKQLRNSEDFSIQAEVFNNRLAMAEEIATAGEKALVSFYSRSKGGDTLDQLRLQNFCQKVHSSTSFVHPQTLPPTSGAARYFSFSLSLSTDVEGVDLPTSWGWKVQTSFQ